MKKAVVLIAASFVLRSCAPSYAKLPVVSPSAEDYGYRRTTVPETYTHIKYDAWDIDGAVEDLSPQRERAHTLMIYMNGSDLESESGAATDDLKEILNARADVSELNIVLLTGGANHWHTPSIPAYECVLSKIGDNGTLEKITGIGQRNMGDAGTLASFISFCNKYFPAKQYSLILWDHGGGTIAGYGGDEHFNDGTLSLIELEYAFHKAGLQDNPLEMLGFDACLMASVEMAVVASRYAQFMVASEATEPQDGWDYQILRTLGNNPSMNGGALGKLITDAYIRSAGLFTFEEMTLSVVDLSEAENVMGAMGRLTEKLGESLQSGYPGLQTIAGYRAGTKTFGTGVPGGADCDMVDLLDLAHEHEAAFPAETASLINALERAVIYNRYISSDALGGLSAYYIYGERTDASQALRVYGDLAMSEAYTEYLRTFASLIYNNELKRRPLYSIRESTVLGVNTRMYAIAEPDGGTLYAVPAEVDGETAEVVAYVPDGGNVNVLGYRKTHGYLIQKGYVPFENENVKILS